MRCAKCGHRIRGATWYCPSCGTPIDDLNVADSVNPTPWSRPWVRLLSAALALFALTGIVGLTARLLEGGADGVRRSVSPTASAGLTIGPSASATSSGPIETLVAAGQNGSSRYPDGAVDAPPDLATATPTAGSTAGSTAGDTADRTAGAGGAPPSPGDGVASSNPGSTTNTPVDPATSDLALSEMPRPTVRVRDGAPMVTVARTSGTLQMDGWLDEWPSAPVTILAVVFGQDAWSGAADLSASARLAWDDQMLYLGVEVTDDLFSQPSTGRDLHLGDSLELQLDVDLAGDFDDGTFSADDSQVGISPGDLDGRAPEVYVWRPSGGAMSGVRVGARATDTGYIIEAALPWAAFGANPQALDAVGASLNVSDNDGPDPAQQTMVASSPRRTWNDPRSWGTWRLAR